MPQLSISTSGQLSIDGTQLDCLVQDINLKNAALLERQSSAQQSGKTSSFTGYDDASIQLNITMHTHNKYKALTQINTAFKTLENNSPAVYSLDFELAKSINIQTAIIQDITISDSQYEGPIIISLTLTETDPPVEQISKQQNTANTTQDTTINVEQAVISDADRTAIAEAQL